MNDLLDSLTELGWESDEARAARVSQAEGLRVLRDFVPEALEIVVHLEHTPPRTDFGIGHDETGYRCAYRWLARGFQWEVKNQPLHTIAWPELDALLGDDVFREQVAVWSEGLRNVDAWRDRTRPFELWPSPEMWHPSYIEGDRARAGYAERMKAWRQVRAMLTGAIERLEGAA